MRPVQRDPSRRAAAGPRLDLEAAVHGAGHFAGDGETEAEAVGIAGPATEESLQDALGLRRRDARASVAHFDEDVVAVGPGGDLDLLAVRMLAGVADEVFDCVTKEVGVRERLALTSKGEAVDVLVLSATPIPRTLVLTYFGDMDVSELREKPAGRQPIDTRAVPLSRLEEVMDGVGRALKSSKRVYWICPFVEESEAEGTEHLTNATKRFESLQKRFGGAVGLVVETSQIVSR